MSRVAIYLTYDEQKIVDAYIGYMLKELKTCVDLLVVVCNEEKVVKGVEYLTTYADVVFYRNNIGYDAGGFKDVLCNLLGWNEILKYDELVLINDSFYGPFCPMQDVFLKMQSRNVDFWGLTKHAAVIEQDKYSGIDTCMLDEHIQSYFLCIRSVMLHSEVFQCYWEEMPYFSTFRECVCQYEGGFTTFFSSHGFVYGGVADMEQNESANQRNNYLQYAHIPYELIKKRNFPFLKRRPLMDCFLHIQTQENFRRALDYIAQCTSYDVDLIWSNLIRVLDVSDLQRNLCLQYVIDDKMVKEMAYLRPLQTALVAVFVEYAEAAEWVLEYLEEIKNCCSIMIFSYVSTLLLPYEQAGYAVSSMTDDMDQGSILAFMTQYEYICVIHDADVTSREQPSCTGKSYLYYIGENLIKNSNYINNVLCQFEQDSYLGFLAPPKPIFAGYFKENSWNGRWEEAVGIMQRLSMVCHMEEGKLPFAITSNFWIRGEILKTLKGEHIQWGNNSIFAYLWTYIAQSAGFYSGVLESSDYAALNQINQQYYLENISAQIRQQCGEFDTFAHMQYVLDKKSIANFCAEHENVYVYGTGIVANQYQDVMSNVKAYIVSDGQPKNSIFSGKKVYYLSEVNFAEDCGIVICLSKKNQAKVIPKLRKLGIINFICVR